MGADKSAAKRGSQRIPERSLFWVAFIGGTAGVYAGMRHFRHKTRHWTFRWGVPLLLVWNLAAVVAWAWAIGRLGE